MDPDEKDSIDLLNLPIFSRLQSSFFMEVVMEACGKDGNHVTALHKLSSKVEVPSTARKVWGVRIVVEHPNIHDRLLLLYLSIISKSIAIFFRKLKSSKIRSYPFCERLILRSLLLIS